MADAHIFVLRICLPILSFNKNFLPPKILSQCNCIGNVVGDFPGGAVVKNPPANAGDMGLSPGPGRSHMPQSN